MEIDLTDRQVALLRAIIQEFMDTAEAVGSLNLPEKYELGVSPATVRNEMARLSKLGLVEKAHASSGRVPTPLGYKLFIQNILDDMENLGVENEVVMREVVYTNRFDPGDLFRKSVSKLAEITGSIGVALFRDRVYYSGVAELIDIPEFHDLGVFKRVLKLLENTDSLTSVFSRFGGQMGTARDDVKILVGEEDIGLEDMACVAMVFGKLSMYKGENGYLGVIGSSRMNYAKIIPIVRWMVRTVNESLRGWN